MKDRSYANRGQTLEAFIKFANDRYRHKKLAHIEKQYTEFIPIRDRKGKIVNCKVEHKATIDFLGRYKSHPVAIEAKHSSTDSIRWDRVEENQADDMDSFISEPGTIGLVVVSFGLKRFFVIPWAFWQAAYNARVRPGSNRKTSVTVTAHGQTWTIPQKNSIRPEELLPQWEIPNHDYDFGIHYLRDAESYITPQNENPENIVKYEGGNNA